MLALLLAVSLQAAAATTDPPDLRVPFDEFKKLYDRGEVLVVDVRSEGAYDEGHIPGAISIPADAIPEKAEELKADKRRIVTYCS